MLSTFPKKTWLGLDHPSNGGKINMTFFAHKPPRLPKRNFTKKMFFSRHISYSHGKKKDVLSAQGGRTVKRRFSVAYGVNLSAVNILHQYVRNVSKKMLMLVKFSF